MNDTPETDAQSPWRYSITTPNGVTTHYVPADFARNLERERNQLRRALAQVAEDCTAWLHNECDEPSVEFIKAIRTYAHEQSQAPLDTANCQLPTANSPE